EFGLCYCDVSTGELKVTHFKDTATLLNEITTINPNEIVIKQALSEELKRQINMITETITVREDISDEDYDMNQLTHQLMHDTTQL
ncbi:DNA mismatch repair protein MutS, partial [Paenibacillus macerans]